MASLQVTVPESMERPQRWLSEGRHSSADTIFELENAARLTGWSGQRVAPSESGKPSKVVVRGTELSSVLNRERSQMSVRC